MAIRLHKLIVEKIKRHKMALITGLVYSFKIILGLSLIHSIGLWLHQPTIWAMITIVVASDPDFKTASKIIKQRNFNTFLGCIVGLINIWLFGENFYSLILSIFITICLSHLVVKQPNWRLAPASTIIVYTGFFLKNVYGDFSPTYLAAQRCIEIVVGGLIALGLSFCFTFFYDKVIKKSQHHT
ncbi:MAG: FUSC family protein [Alphaproteobacteria bacterium]|nr:FUSC family protein [Alphaproteobacteria bacterium]